jgi:hypothetical protein
MTNNSKGRPGPRGRARKDQDLTQVSGLPKGTSQMHAPPSPVRRGTVALGAILAAAVVVPGVADAKQVKGTVVAKDVQRGTLVTAARSGAVTTLRTTGIKRYRVGQRIAAAAAARPDGTFAASGKVQRRKGTARTARVRATVVQRAGGRYLLSAGSSTFAIGRRGAGAAAAAPQPGDIVVADVRLGGNGATGARVKTVGQAAMLEVEGILLGSADGVLRLAVEKRGEVAVTVPEGQQISAAPGDEIEAIVSVEADGTFTLVSVRGEDDSQDGGLDFDAEKGSVDAEGVVGALSETSLTVDAGGGASLTCAVPAGTSLGGLAVGDDVAVQCRLLPGGGFELVQLESGDIEIDLSDSEDESEPAPSETEAARSGRQGQADGGSSAGSVPHGAPARRPTS